MFSFCIPTEFVFGTGCFKELHKYNLPGKKALIVITNGKSIRNSGYLAELENQLSLAGKSMKFLTVLPRIRLLTVSWTQLKPRRTLPATLLSVSEAAPYGLG